MWKVSKCNGNTSWMVAAAIAGAAQMAIKQTSRVVVVVVEYPIIEVCIRLAIT